MTSPIVLPLCTGLDGEIFDADGRCYIQIDPNRELRDDQVAAIARLIVDRVNGGRYERLVRRIAEWTDGEIAVVCPRQTRHVAQVVVAGADPVYPSFAPTAPAPPVEGLTSGEGWVYWNPDAGEEYADSHPVRSGECVDAEHIRPSTPQEDVLWRAMQEQFTRAENLASPKATATASVREKARHIETLEYLRTQYLPGGPRDILGALRAGIAALTDSGTAATIGGERT